MKTQSKSKCYYVRIMRDNKIVGSLSVSAETSVLWSEVIALFGKACLAFEPVPAFETKIEIEVRPE